MRLAGTSNTASAPSSCATVTIIWPARTTSPASAPVEITAPGASASKLRVAELVLGRMQLRLGDIDFGLGACGTIFSAASNSTRVDQP